MIVQIMQAALERAADPEHLRRPAFVYIDEAADYFEENIDTLLIQARKYKVGLTFAHQHLDQLSAKLYSSVMTNPAVRFVGGLSASDARALAPVRNLRPQSHGDPRHPLRAFRCGRAAAKDVRPPVLRAA